MSVGRPRPDLIARCIPVAGAHDHAVFGLSTEAICTTTNLAILHDGFKVSRYTQDQGGGTLMSRLTSVRASLADTALVSGSH
jgi:hypothetical protein